MPEINKDLLLHRILHSKELTALEKRYLEAKIQEPERPHGTWVKGLDDGEGYHCSRCRVWKKHVQVCTSARIAARK